MIPIAHITHLHAYHLTGVWIDTPKQLSLLDL